MTAPNQSETSTSTSTKLVTASLPSEKNAPEKPLSLESSNINKDDDIDQLVQLTSDSFGLSKNREKLIPGRTIADPSERRKAFLLKQKEKRRDAFELARKIAMGEGSDASDSSDDEDFMGKRTHANQTEGQPEPYINNAKIRCLGKEKRVRPKRPYRNKVMISEVLEVVPDDLSKAWAYKACPIGKRCLVVSNGGSTSAYQKNGYKIATFSSGLPGGSKLGNSFGSRNYCLLDCIFDEGLQKFYILDLMCWKSQPFFDDPSSLRFFWLDSRVAEELPGLKTKSKFNAFPFEVLPYGDCSPGFLSRNFMYNQPLSTLDGLLFYHQNCFYKHGRSPLCLWLPKKQINEKFEDGIIDNEIVME